jgi:hypothetical protein
MRLFVLPRAAAAQITGVPATLRRLSRTIPTLPHFDAPDFPDHLAQTLATTASHLAQTRHTLLENFPTPNTPTNTPQPHPTSTAPASSSAINTHPTPHVHPPPS